MNSKSLSDYYYNHSFMDGLRKKLTELLPNTYCIAAIDIEHLISCMEEVPETKLSAIFVPV